MSDDGLDNVIPLFKSTPDDSMRQKINEMWAVYYTAAGETLANEDTAKALRSAASVFDMLFEGLCVTGSITEEQRDTLRWWAASAKTATEEM